MSAEEFMLDNLKAIRVLNPLVWGWVYVRDNAGVLHPLPVLHPLRSPLSSTGTRSSLSTSETA